MHLRKARNMHVQHVLKTRQGCRTFAFRFDAFGQAQQDYIRRL